MTTDKPPTRKQQRAAKRAAQQAYDAARYEKRKLSTVCKCGNVKEPGALHCDRCEPSVKKRVAAATSRWRAAIVKAGACPTCRLPKERNTVIPDSVLSALSFHTERGPKGNAPASSRTGARRGAGLWREEVHNGKRSLRFHGQGKRGSPSKAVNDQQDRKQIEATLERGFQLLAVLESQQVKELPKGEQKSARDAGCAQLKLVIRFLEQILDRHGYEP